MAAAMAISVIGMERPGRGMAVAAKKATASQRPASTENLVAIKATVASAAALAMIDMKASRGDV